MFYYISVIIIKFQNLSSRFYNYFYAINKRKNYSIDKTVKFHNNTFIYGSGKIIIGPNTYFGRETFVVSEPADSIIQIGCNCKISHGVHIRTYSYSTSKNRDPKFSNISIGDNVWIGANVFICGGVSIGDNVTIGANSVVTKNIENNSIVGGVPAKLIKNIDEV
jgi:maltose O-acetyltransferase